MIFHYQYGPSPALYPVLSISCGVGLQYSQAQKPTRIPAKASRGFCRVAGCDHSQTKAPLRTPESSIDGLSVVAPASIIFNRGSLGQVTLSSHPVDRAGFKRRMSHPTPLRSCRSAGGDHPLDPTYINFPPCCHSRTQGVATVLGFYRAARWDLPQQGPFTRTCPHPVCQLWRWSPINSDATAMGEVRYFQTWFPAQP